MAAKRAGRPWGPARGPCQEINELVTMIRGWLDRAGVPVRVLHQRLTPEYFTGRRVPDLRRLRERLAGVDLEWGLVEAVADVCFPGDSPQATARRLTGAKALWQAAQQAPTAPDPAGSHPALTRELLAAKDRTIAAYQEIDRARQAHRASEHGRHQALQVSVLLLALLGQAQERIAELSRRLDDLQSRPARDPQVVALGLCLQRAQGQERTLRQALTRAGEERDSAQPAAGRSGEGDPPRRVARRPGPGIARRPENGRRRGGGTGPPAVVPNNP